MGWLARHDAGELTAVAIAPDLGERYLDTIYQTNWLRLYGEEVLSSDELTARLRDRLPAPPARLLLASPDHVPGYPGQGCRPGDRHRAGPGRGAGRGRAGRAGVGRQPLLRRPGCGLDGDGPVLRPGQEAAGPAVGVDEGRLPAPDDQSLATALADATLAPAERALAEVLAEVLRVERVSVDSHFFDDLGADSLVMAQFCARVRKRADLPSVSMKDIYQHPTIRSLATALADTTPAPAESPAPARGAGAGAGRHGPVRPVRNAAVPVLPRLLLPRRVACSGAIEWISAGSGVIDGYLRAVVSAGRLPRRVRPSDPGEVGAHRPVEAPADPHLEPGVRPLLDRQDAGPVQPVLFFSVRRSTCSICGRWARRSGGASRSSPGMCPCAPTCSPSATARSSARTRSSPATGPTPA